MESSVKRPYCAPATRLFSVAPQGFLCYSGNATESVGTRDGYSDADFD